VETVERLFSLAPEPGASGPEAAARRLSWRAAVAAALAAEDMWAPLADSATGEGLYSLVRILAGEEEALVRATSNWRELFSALLCHVYPQHSSPRDLMRIAAACIARHSRVSPPPAPTGPLDELLLCSLECDAAQCLRLCAAQLDGWFCCHAAPLLAAAGPAQHALLFSPLPGGDGRSVAQFFALEYGAACAATPSLRHASFAYLKAAGAQGERAMLRLLRQLPGDNRAVLRDVALARRYAGEEAAGGVCRAAGERAEAANALGQALLWYSRGGVACGAALDRLVQRQLVPTERWTLPEPAICAALELSFAPAEAACGVQAFARLQAAIGRAAKAVLQGEPAEAATAHEEAAAALRLLLSGAEVPRALWPAVARG
jgi:hypothetical protein